MGATSRPWRSHGHPYRWRAARDGVPEEGPTPPTNGISCSSTASGTNQNTNPQARRPNSTTASTTSTRDQNQHQNQQHETQNQQNQHQNQQDQNQQDQNQP